MVGEFKDDSIKSHYHPLNFDSIAWSDIEGSWQVGNALRAMQYAGSIGFRKIQGLPSNTNNSGGIVTRGKRKAVKYIIKVL